MKDVLTYKTSPHRLKVTNITLKSIERTIDQLNTQIPYEPVQRYYIGRLEQDLLEKRLDPVLKNTKTKMCDLLYGVPITILNRTSFCAKEVKPEKLSTKGWRCDIVYWDGLDMIIQSLKEKYHGRK